MWSNNVVLTVVIPTRNEEKNIRDCIEAFIFSVKEGWGEIIVVDNFSTDDTQKICLPFLHDYPDKVRFVSKGTERSFQRNEGARNARGKFVFFVDADMRVPEETLRELRTKIMSENIDGLYVKEVRIGNGWWTKVRNFERSFYDATCIDALRVIRLETFDKCGGYDEKLFAAEDWDLDQKILQITSNVALTNGHLLHDERRLSFGKHLKKKSYYSGCFSAYQEKWKNNSVIKKQFGAWYRLFGVFLENGKWKRAICHPIFMTAIWFERFCVGVVYLFNKIQP